MCLKVLKNTFTHTGKIVQTHWFSLKENSKEKFFFEDVRAGYRVDVANVLGSISVMLPILF